MKSTGLWIISALLQILLFSCAQKEARTPVSVSPSKIITGSRVHKITYGEDPEAEKWFTYTREGEIKAYNSFLDTVFFSYYPDSIHKIYSQSDHQWQTSVTYYLDTTGKAVSSILRGEDNEIISKYKFFYDDRGYLKETNQDVITSETSYKQTFSYEGGNLTEVTQFDFEGKPYARYLYTYDKNLHAPADIFQHNILEDFLSFGRLGNQNVNLPLSLVNVTMEGDTLSYLKFTYPNLKNQSVLIQVEEDVLNENLIERKYHLEKFEVETNLPPTLLNHLKNQK